MHKTLLKLLGRRNFLVSFDQDKQGIGILFYSILFYSICSPQHQLQEARESLSAAGRLSDQLNQKSQTIQELTEKGKCA
jgi:hypothetical protein